jgi:hypothetical protein
MKACAQLTFSAFAQEKETPNLELDKRLNESQRAPGRWEDGTVSLPSPYKKCTVSAMHASAQGIFMKYVLLLS